MMKTIEQNRTSNAKSTKFLEFNEIDMFFNYDACSEINPKIAGLNKDLEDFQETLAIQIYRKKVETLLKSSLLDVQKTTFHTEEYSYGKFVKITGWFS